MYSSIHPSHPSNPYWNMDGYLASAVVLVRISLQYNCVHITARMNYECQFFLRFSRVMSLAPNENTHATPYGPHLHPHNVLRRWFSSRFGVTTISCVVFSLALICWKYFRRTFFGPSLCVRCLTCVVVVALGETFRHPLQKCVCVRATLD